MTLARSSLVSLSATPYYHVIGRCVRRAFLCGIDSVSGRSFEHRRDWVVERLVVLSSLFAVGVCAYAVMSNHYHLVLKLDRAVADDWSDDEVLERWCAVYAGHDLVQQYRAGESMSRAALVAVSEYIDLYRRRLCDLSWFMRSLNHDIACRANAEDNCTGHFWEGRFKSQALLDEQALISCMAYVDLNPIRAAMAETPEQSDYTSIQQRISATKPEVVAPESLSELVPKLLGFVDKLDSDSGLPFGLNDYLDLVDWSGRAIHPDKHGKIPDNIPPILARLGIAPVQLLKYLSRQERGFAQVMGKASTIRAAVKDLGAKFLMGVSAANRLFPQLN